MLWQRPEIHALVAHAYIYEYFFITLILLQLFQQHYCDNVTGQSQESEGYCKPARIKENTPNYIRSRLRCVDSQLLS